MSGTWAGREKSREVSSVQRFHCNTHTHTHTHTQCKDNRDSLVVQTQKLKGEKDVCQNDLRTATKDRVRYQYVYVHTCQVYAMQYVSTMADTLAGEKVNYWRECLCENFVYTAPLCVPRKPLSTPRRSHPQS